MAVCTFQPWNAEARESSPSTCAAVKANHCSLRHSFCCYVFDASGVNLQPQARWDASSGPRTPCQLLGAPALCSTPGSPVLPAQPLCALLLQMPFIFQTFLFRHMVSLSSSGWPGAHLIAHPGLELSSLLAAPP